MLLLVLPSVLIRVRLLFLLFSVFFRVNPWQMLLFVLVLISVAYSASAYFRGNPW